MKGAGTTRWADPNTGRTNESGFTSLPDLTGNKSYYPTSKILIQRAAGIGILVGAYYVFTSQSPELRKSFSDVQSMPIRCIKN